MRRFGLWTVALASALASAVVTSLVWMIAFNWGPVSTAVPEPRQAEGQAPPQKAELEIGPSGLAIPVAGIKPDALADTYTQARSGGRVHNAIDIMAPHGTPVVAAAEGTVEKLFFSKGGGGITVYVRSPDQKWVYYYAHLDAYAPGLTEGQKVRRGDVLGTVGSTGNANPAGPHLHFAVHSMREGEDWHEGSPINPYPLLAPKD
jgi:peptidoglycan LD-endopeptidase LytH